MARAARPGTKPPAEADKQRQQGIRITVRGETADVYPSDIGPRDDSWARRETNKPAAFGYKLTLTAALGQLQDEDGVGTDSLCLLWHWGRWKAGLTEETLAEALDRFPNVGELDDDDVFSVEELTGEEAEGDDPLPSGEA